MQSTTIATKSPRTESTWVETNPAVEASLADVAAEGYRGHKYEQLRRQIVEQITTGRLKPGDPLPTERWWAETNDLARNTVRQAMSLLERDGLISRMQGKGTFVHERARERLHRGLDLFALVLPETQAGFYPALQRSFDEAAGLHHHQLVVCNTGNDVDRQASIVLQLMDKQVAGVALVPVTSLATPAYQVRQLQKAGIPVVFCHRRVEGVNAPLLEIPFPEISRLVARAVSERGHRRVAFFASQENATTRALERDLRAGLAEAGGAIVPQGGFFAADGDSYSLWEPQVTAALREMLDRDDRPTAIFATFDPLAELIDGILARMGVRVPDDISLIGFGGISRSTPLMQRLTSATIDEIQVGRRAAEVLDRMRRGEIPLDDNRIDSSPVGLSSGKTLGSMPALPARFDFTTK